MVIIRPKKKELYHKKRLLTTLLVSGFLFAVFASAASAQVDLGMNFAMSFGLPSNDIRILISGIIRSLLGLVGFILVLMIMLSGFKYMTHGGNEEVKSQAIGGIKDAVIGLIIMMISFSAAQFLIEAVADATGIL
ncbi:hypothetical protein A2480_01320 [Candidatus Uhrbacteria bacterium RIFOXYC2_FULL_47_19]|uniref:Uncharacterized protein n=1 Tax=Candidatus Uhrbacteria bacterium RIFOXYC2_FULL_47_19 TaxID=1802424 RepID=A0A1F7WDE5_9BACT|nr:MAG: hypothetical protein A2480_01320 [Candidatus Uhrbacteria bacterium RIFOXYC2_FULL_47_19]HCC22421.1 hypothetical protein [Candidatus Uhrbacteria bacterium]